MVQISGFSQSEMGIRIRSVLAVRIIVIVQLFAVLASEEWFIFIASDGSA